MTTQRLEEKRVEERVGERERKRERERERERKRMHAGEGERERKALAPPFISLPPPGLPCASWA